MSLEPGARLGPYEVTALIGAGGMGEVYQARDTRLGRAVAIKVLPAGVATDPDPSTGSGSSRARSRDERRRRFEHEVRAVSALNHPHICTLHDIGTYAPPGGGPVVDYLVMEFLEGQTLFARLTKGPLPLAQAMEYGAQIADAPAQAHRQGIVHRDLKPVNVMLTGTGVKLLDFGLAKLKPAGREVLAGASALTTAASLTSDGQILGTLPYMAPEQLEDQDVDARSDLFAFGAVLCEMLTGRRAFEGASQAIVVATILEREPPPVSSARPLTPPALDRLVRTCLAKDPAKRWDSAHDVAEQLRALADTSDSGAAQLAPSATSARSRRPDTAAGPSCERSGARGHGCRSRGNCSPHLAPDAPCARLRAIAGRPRPALQGVRRAGGRVSR